MLIICTRDQAVIDWVANPASQSHRWAPIRQIPPHFDQQHATEALWQALREVRRDEALCFSAHGNRHEIGDANGGWGWNAKQIAELMIDALPPDYRGNILIRACGDQEVAFGSTLARALEARRAFRGIWIYDYKKALPGNTPYPDPATLDRNVELSPNQVWYYAPLASGSATGQRRYQVLLPHGAVLQLHSGFDADEVARLLTVLSQEAGSNRDFSEGVRPPELPETEVGASA